MLTWPGPAGSCPALGRMLALGGTTVGYPKHWMVPQTFAAKVLRATLDSDPTSRVLFSTVPLRSTHRFLRVSASSIRTALIRRPCPQGKAEVAAGGGHNCALPGSVLFVGGCIARPRRCRRRPAGVGRQQPLHFAPD